MMFVPPAVLKGLSACVSDDVSRTSLQSVHLERGFGDRCLACATDGKILLSVGWKEKEEEALEAPSALGNPACLPGFKANIPGRRISELRKLVPTAKELKPFAHRYWAGKLLVEEPTANGTIRVSSGIPGSPRESTINADASAYPEVDAAVTGNLDKIHQSPSRQSMIVNPFRLLQTVKAFCDCLPEGKAFDDYKAELTVNAEGLPLLLKAEHADECELRLNAFVMPSVICK